MYDIDSKSTIDIIEQMRLAKIGDYNKWKKLVKKLQNNQGLNQDEIKYFARLARTYKNSKITVRSKILHIRLSDEDQKPKCRMCKEDSEFYCNQNDAYFCKIHVVGHDQNER